MEENKFDQLGLDSEILRSIESMGFDVPTEIQKDAIPILMEGKDLIGQAQTGTGKTLAFGAPMLSKIGEERNIIKGIVLTPTRELAIQVSEELRRVSKYRETKITAVYGGSPIRKQIQAIKSNTDIIVGTPGRVLDLLNRKVIKLKNIDYFILDEADEMLNMGFIDDIEEIMKNSNEERQTLLFSATMPKKIKILAKKYMKPDLEHVAIAKKSITTSNVEQSYFETNQRNKFEVLCRLLDYYSPSASILFCNTKRDVDELVVKLKNKGYNVEGMHGDMTQGFRMRTLSNFREKKIKILVATDVAARGIDISHITHVINYGLPYEIDLYAHRIGRTGRADRSGKSFTIITKKERNRLRQIEKELNCTIAKKEIPKSEEIFNIKSEEMLEETIKEIKKIEHAEFEEMADTLLSKYDAKDIISYFLYSKYKDDVSYEKDDKAFEQESSEGSNNTRMFINIGKKDGLTSRKLMSFLTKELNMGKRDIKNVTVLDKFSFFNLNNAEVDKTMKNLKNKKYNRREINIEVASGR